MTTRWTLLVVLALSVMAATSLPADAASRSACDAVTRSDLREVLSGTPRRPDPAEIGEETAPSCIWMLRGGQARVKIETWSGDEVQVVGEKTPWSYFSSRRREALKFRGAQLDGIGEVAFRTRFGRDPSGEIGVIKNHRFLVFSFEHVPMTRALKFTKAIVSRL